MNDMTHRDEIRPPRWMAWVLVLAGAYNLAWGLLVVFFPLRWFEFVELDPPRYPQIWQCVGMIVGVYGIGYLIAAADPIRHWPITLVGLLGKIFGPIGFLLAVVQGELPWSFGAILLTNDLIWWLPFAAILYHASTTSKRVSDQPAASATETKTITSEDQDG